MARLFILLLLITLIFSGCQNSPKTILIDGSTTVFELSNDWAKTYMEQNPDTTVKVTAAGTDNGIKALINGECDIAESSRKITEEEVLQGKQKNIDIGEFYGGFAIYSVVVNPKNTVSQLTEEQIKKIFSGEIKNWKDLGGKDQKITVIYREIKEGEYDYFLEKYINISKDKLTAPPENTKILPSPEAIASEIEKNESTISYLFIKHLNNKIKAVEVGKEAGGFFSPTVENSISGQYPVLRPYYMYINKYSPKLLREYIYFTYSDKGAELAKKHGFVPVPMKNGNVDKDVILERI